MEEQDETGAKVLTSSKQRGSLDKSTWSKKSVEYNSTQEYESIMMINKSFKRIEAESIFCQENKL